MTWISTASGRKVDFAAPDPAAIVIDDIAAGLAAMPRWAGHTMYRDQPRAYSVAQHSWHVADKCAGGGPRLALMALLHDATEAYMGDCPRPLKNLLGPAWNVIERRLLVAIFARFGLELDAELSPAIKQADDRMLMTERRDLQPHCPPWESGPWPEPYDDVEIRPWPYHLARHSFLQTFCRLRRALEVENASVA